MSTLTARRTAPPHPHRGAPGKPDPALDSDAADLHAALNGLKRVFQFRDRERICCYDVSVTQCWALEALVRAGPLTLNQLAAELYLEKSTASRVVDALERKGYVERARHPEDGRALLLRPTRAGRRLQARIEADILKEERRLLAGFDPVVRRSMVELLKRLGAAAASRVESSGGRCCSLDFVKKR